MKKRVLVGQIFQEAHGFTPLLTTLDSFAIETGQEMLAANANADSVLGGILRTGIQEDWQMLPTIAARASPGGKITNAAYAFIKQHLIDGARRGGFDAIALCLHGCIQTESLDSAELDLLTDLRQIVGPDIPIVAGFDLHAHAGGGMLGMLDFGTAYKSNPHGDAGSTGERVGRVLAQMLNSGLRPIAATVLVPMLTRGNDETGQGPLHLLHSLARKRIESNSRLLDASIFNVNPFIDGVGVGQTVVVYATDPRGLEEAAALAEEIGNGLWATRDEFQHNLPTLAEVLLEQTGRVTVGDFGDRVLAGAPGDSIYLVDQLLSKFPAKRVVAPVTDPSAVAACQMAGLGAQLTLTIGGTHTPDAKSMVLTGTVQALGNGSYRNRGAFMRGTSLRIGDYAVFSGYGLTFLITKEPLMSQDPGCFLDVGIDLSLVDVIVVKSGYHFKLAFDQLGACICVVTPGLSTFNPSVFPIIKARPLYPLDDFNFTAKAFVGDSFRDWSLVL